MRSKALLLGHPAHAMLVPFPFAFLTGAFVFDLSGLVFGRDTLWVVATYLSGTGVVLALVAAVPGVIDYLYTVPPRSSAKTRGTQHLSANLSAVALFAVAWFMRDAASRPGTVVLGLEAVAALLLAMGAYLGGTLVTRNLIGVDHRYARAGKWKETRLPKRHFGRVAVGTRNDLEVDQMKLVVVGRRRIVIARTADGYTACDDRCTHRGGSLAGGVLINGTVQCLWHGSQFDASTGSVCAGPADSPIHTYEVVEDDSTGNLFCIVPRDPPP